MNNNQLKYGLIGAVIGGIAIWLLSTTALNSSNTGMMNFKSNSQSPLQNSKELDAHFIEQMIPHHEDAITMGKLAQTKAKRSEIKQLAQNIIESQSKEINQMKDWYKMWFGKDVPIGNQVMNQHGMMGSKSGMHMGMMGDETDMVRLEQAADFDKEFIVEMIPHHQMAVMMTNMLLQGTNRPEMKQLGEDIIAAQTKEINQMRQWYKDWGY